MKVTVEIPDETAKLLGLTEETAGRTLLEEVVAQAYRDKKIGNKRLREILGLSWHEKEEFLFRHKIFYEFTAEDVIAEAESLRQLRESKRSEKTAA